jgi:hypothetical protein
VIAGRPYAGVDGALDACSTSEVRELGVSVSPLFGRKDHEGGTAQGIEALQAEFDRLNALPIRQLALKY